jgi:hypothetical protein
MQNTTKGIKRTSGSIILVVLGLLVVLSTLARFAEAQNTPVHPDSDQDMASNASSRVPCPPADAIDKVLVTRAFKRTGGKEEPKAALGDEIIVAVDNLRPLLNKASCTTPARKVLLFLDGKPLKDVTPFPPTHPDKPFLIFPLKRTESSRDIWTHILGRPQWNARTTSVSIGLDGEYPVESKAEILLDVIPHGIFIFALVLIAALLAGFLALAVKSDLLRDSGPAATGTARKPYSLSRTQAAWWFFLIIASYVFIGIITGDFSTTITGTVLVLLGISAGTVVGSAFIDAGKEAAVPPPAAAVAGGPAVPAVRPAAVSEYWWIDILSDANGVSFHRFQIAAWTIALGIIFIVEVWQVLAMPTFDGSLLGLMGISAGTYLGLKIPEPK